MLDLVKAFITGAILGNILLIFGLSIIAGGFKHKEQFFNKENTGVQSSVLFLAVIGLAIPTVLATTALKPVDTSDQLKIQFLSGAIAFLLLAVYVAGMIFTFITHKHLFTVRLSPEPKEEGKDHRPWSKKKSFVLLGISKAGVVIVVKYWLDQ